MVLKLFSPAKVNLYLHVLRRRPDGFHELETLFERISLGDEIILKEIPSGIVFCTDSKDVPADASNLAWRAASLLKEHCRVSRGVEIRLKKKIPVSAGLGGGSSNAATVLLGLNRLWKLRLSQKKLLGLASELGSDVPFFILDTPFALARGRGEVLKKISAPGRKFWHCVVKPPFGISTKEAYKGLNLPSSARPPRRGQGLTPPKPNVKMLLHSIQRGDSARLSRLLINSLEVSLNNRVTTILEIKNSLLEQGAFASLLSGSGSAVFGLFRTRQKAVRAAHFLKKKKSWQVFVASTC